MTTKLTMLLLFGLLLCCHATAAARHLRHGDVRKHENAIQDDVVGPKSFILEKYGKHYKLTGGSTLARRRGDVVNIGGGSPVNISKADNSSAQVSNTSINKEKNETVKVDNTNTDNSTVHLTNNTYANDDKNRTVKDVESYTNATTPDNSNLKNSTNLNETVTNLQNSSSSNSDLGNTTQGANKTVASKSEIAIVRDKEPAKDDKGETTNTKEENTNSKEAATSTKGADADNKEAVINATEARRKATPAALMGWEEAEQAGDTTQINFGPPADKLPHNSENNVSSEGNLTTIKLDLTNGYHEGEVVNAVIPGLDGNTGPNTQVDIIYGNNSNGPKRSPDSKPKKHIVYEITKPQMMINDFAHKRKHVAYRSQHVVHVNKAWSSKRKHISHLNRAPQEEKHVARVKAVFSNKRKHVVHVKAVPANRRKHVIHVYPQVANKRRRVVHVKPAPANKRKHVSHVKRSHHANVSRKAVKG